MNKQEKRFSKRRKAQNIYLDLHSLDPQIWFRYWGDQNCLLRDISLVGVGVYLQERFSLGMPLSIDIQLGKSSGQNIRVFGRVCWVRQEDKNYRTGISFSWWKNDQDKKELNSYLEKLSLTN
ncbi:MAG: PilZ domain-containing protein [Candidatus Omnitrophota bacterium]